MFALLKLPAFSWNIWANLVFIFRPHFFDFSLDSELRNQMPNRVKRKLRAVRWLSSIWKFSLLLRVALNFEASEAEDFYSIKNWWDLNKQISAEKWDLAYCSIRYVKSKINGSLHQSYYGTIVNKSQWDPFSLFKSTKMFRKVNFKFQSFLHKERSRKCVKLPFPFSIWIYLGQVGWFENL